MADEMSDISSGGYKGGEQGSPISTEDDAAQEQGESSVSPEHNDAQGQEDPSVSPEDNAEQGTSGAPASGATQQPSRPSTDTRRTPQLATSNPERDMKTKWIGNDIFTYSLPFRRFGFFDIGGRCTIIRMSNGHVAVFSPLPLTPTVTQVIGGMGGNVGYIVALNMDHHLFLKEWASRYPAAILVGPHFLQDKINGKPQGRRVHIDHAIRPRQNGTQLPDDFQDEFDIEYFHMLRTQEVVVLHRESETLIEADLFYYIAERPVKREKLWMGLYASTVMKPKPFVRRVLWFFRSASRRAAYKRSTTVLASWLFDRVIPCHGDIIEEHGKPALITELYNGAAFAK